MFSSNYIIIVIMLPVGSALAEVTKLQYGSVSMVI